MDYIYPTPIGLSFVLGEHTVVSIWSLSCFCLVIVPLEYIPTIPLHSIYVIVSCFVLFKSYECPHSVGSSFHNEEVYAGYTPVEQLQDKKHKNDPRRLLIFITLWLNMSCFSYQSTHFVVVRRKNLTFLKLVLEMNPQRL